MIKKEEKMKKLQEMAIRIYDGMPVVWPQCDHISTLEIEGHLPKFNGCYAVNNSTVIFATENEAYVSLYTRKLVSELCELGFKRKDFYVPFSNGDYPRDEESKWKDLKEQAQKTYAEDIETDYLNYCEKNGIEGISQDSIQNCLKLPGTGVRIRWRNYEDTVWPLLDEYSFDCRANEYLGTYNCNNGKVVFIYKDGKTYVTKGYGIVKELDAAGYKQKNLFVPLSNGEEILDLGLKMKWESIEHRR